MASKSSQLQSLVWLNEAAFGDTLTTITTRALPAAYIDTSGLVRPSEEPTFAKAYPNEGWQNVRMPFRSSFTVEFYLTGQGATMAGGVVASDLTILLGYLYGTVGNGLATGQTATGGTASVPTTSGGSGIAAGALVHIGAKADTRGDGQWVANGSHSSSAATLLTAMPAAPSNGDVIYASKMVYPSQTAGTYETVTSLKFRIGSPQQTYTCHGCFATGDPELILNYGQLPRIRITFAVAWWELQTTAFPPSSTADDNSPSPIVGGSFF